MKTFEKKLELPIDADFLKTHDLSRALFFDIETTGFSPKNTFVYMIGCVYQEKPGNPTDVAESISLNPDTINNSFILKQFFCENSEDEPELLNEFFQFAIAFTTVYHYNGAGFDIPYIEEKCKKYSLPYNFSIFTSIDIYKELIPYKHILKLINLKQKTVEDFLDVPRMDLLSGGDLINIYQQYQNSHSTDYLAKILLHNHDDLLGMIGILNIFSYICLFNGDFSIDDTNITIQPYKKIEDIDGKEIIITLSLNNTLNKRISYSFDEFYITAFKNTAKIRIGIYTDELKFFYPNYKDYYYLPHEDTSIHKSVAFYVDKNYRTKAKAANCYSKKTGTFLPQYTEIISPYFKIDYHDSITYFEITDEFLNNTDCIKNYCIHILNEMRKRK